MLIEAALDAAMSEHPLEAAVAAIAWGAVSGFAVALRRGRSRAKSSSRGTNA